jgi:uncharacterized protein
MRTSHQLLLRLWHDPEYVFDRVRVVYVNRGAPGDRSCVTGDAIGRLDANYLEILSEIGVTCIPYHRIRQILYGDTVLWKHRGRQDK